MNKIDNFSEIRNFLAERSVSFLTDIRKEGKGSAKSNTYFVSSDGKNYIVDPAWGSKRISEIKKENPFKEFDILVTHSHLDHSANSGAVALKNSKVIFHPVVASRINNLRRNYTEITAALAETFGVKGLFTRTRLTGPGLIVVLNFLQKYIPPLFRATIFIVSIALMVKNVGRIYNPGKKSVFLSDADKKEFTFKKAKFSGWRLSENLYAFDTPGHEKDHLSFYISDRKIFFAGDLINFLNPNDIIDGSIKETHEGMKNVLHLAEAGGIEILAAGHQIPFAGKEKSIQYLKSIIERQNEVFETVSAIVSSCPDKTDFEYIIKKIYSHDSELMKLILKINYPRSISFIDVYVHIYIKEFVL